MLERHGKNTVRYYLILMALIVFLFFSNDFGLLDVQKTAIVMAAGIDREEDSFIVTSQIAIPQSSKQGKATEAVQIVSRGKTVADAFEEINTKTGWYPKLVFCRLIVLGKKTTEEDVFDALDYFLRDEYLSDNCLLATCDGYAKDILNTEALVDQSASLAIQKVLSAHSERVGTVLPSTLREFSIGYFSDSRSGFLPVLKTEPQQEQIGNNPSPENSSSSSSDSSSGNSDSAAQSSSSGESGGGGGEKKDKPVFSASETALFVGGKRVDTLTREETFAFGSVMGKLRLAPYSVAIAQETCTLTIKHNSPKIDFSVGKNKRVCLKIDVTLNAGIQDYSKSQNLSDIADVGNVPKDLFNRAEKKLEAEIVRVFEKCRKSGCDLFGVLERLEKYEKRHFTSLKDVALDSAIANVNIRFRNVR